ncbi:MAG: hypothetical protein KJ077_24440 [Anaerolineae bacterium]|nr:hypothetical protein [Anaerolineae bacterium]
MFPVALPLILLALTFSVTGSVLTNTSALTSDPIILTEGLGEYPPRPFASRAISYHYLIFALFSSPPTEQTFYLHFQSDDPLSLPLTLRRVALLWSKNMVQCL